MIKPILVVDLDDTLIKTDMLHETFWSAFSLDWKIIIKTFCKIFSCKAKLKKFLYSKSNVEVDLLPYNENIIKYIKEFRSKGGKTALVTASNQAVAQKIAHYLDIFDEVHGSSGSNNLKGENKAKFLSSHYKNSKFIYIGDSYTDLYVWKVAQKAITIGANLRLQNKVELINKNYEHLTSDKILISNFIKAMRPHQWLKNILVFLPMLAAHQLETQTFVKSIVAFFSFSFIASSVYIINDLLDLNADRAHSSKKNRPFASGLIPIKYGGLIAALLFIIGLFLASLSNELFLYTIFFYYFLTLVYSLDLKRIILVDIFCLAVLYTIRVIGGGLSSNINLTFWLLAFSIFFFLSLATVKRQAEIVGLKKNKKMHIKRRGYTFQDLSLVTTLGVVSAGISVTVMALYINSPSVISLYQTPIALLGVCFILFFWLVRMSFIAHRGEMHDDPIIFAVNDKVSQICLIILTSIVIFGAIW